MEFNTPLFQEELQEAPSLMGSKSASPSLSSNPPPLLLSSPASLGASSAKVSKRKSRAVNKPPIRVLSADRATFRDMVQKLTGIPASPSLQASPRPWGAASNPSAELFRPHHQSTPTLDTSSAYLSRGFSSNRLLGNSRYDSQYRANLELSAQPASIFGLRGGVMYGGEAFSEGGMAMDMESSRQQQHQALELESLFMGSNKLEDLLQRNKVDNWLSPDLIHTPSPHVDIAHSA